MLETSIRGYYWQPLLAYVIAAMSAVMGIISISQGNIKGFHDFTGAIVFTIVGLLFRKHAQRPLFKTGSRKRDRISRISIIWAVAMILAADSFFLRGDTIAGFVSLAFAFSSVRDCFRYSEPAELPSSMFTSLNIKAGLNAK